MFFATDMLPRAPQVQENGGLGPPHGIEYQHYHSTLTYLDTASKSNSDHTTIKNLTTKRPRVRARSSSLTQTTPASYSAKASYWADSRRSFCKFGLGTTRDLARATPGIEVHGFWTPLKRTVHAIDGWNVEPRNEPQLLCHRNGRMRNGQKVTHNVVKTSPNVALGVRGPRTANPRRIASILQIRNYYETGHCKLKNTNNARIK